MKNSSWLLCVAFAPLAFAVGCGSSSPENFIKKSTEIGCRYAKKCEKDDWDEAGYDSVKDCRDDLVSDDEADAFAEACEDFDRGAARKCLAGLRKAKRKCDEDAASDEQEEACAEVCGSLDIGELTRNPDTTDVVTRILEDAVGQYEDMLIEEEELGAEPLEDLTSFDATPQ